MYNINQYVNEEIKLEDGKGLTYDKNKSTSKPKNMLFAFKVDDSMYADIKNSIDSGVWLSNTPLKLIKDGPTGEYATLGRLPVYLAISMNDSNIQLDKADRIYVKLQMKPSDLINKLEEADNYMERIRTYVTTSDNIEYSLEMWRG